MWVVWAGTLAILRPASEVSLVVRDTMLNWVWRVYAGIVSLGNLSVA
jgi:hypothetical protein